MWSERKSAGAKDLHQWSGTKVCAHSRFRCKKKAAGRNSLLCRSPIREGDRREERGARSC